jgi:hypothetical protein
VVWIEEGSVAVARGQNEMEEVGDQGCAPCPYLMGQMVPYYGCHPFGNLTVWDFTCISQDCVLPQRVSWVGSINCITEVAMVLEGGSPCRRFATIAISLPVLAADM